jgi:branched-chain amino acid transport system ATP-binding protein
MNLLTVERLVAGYGPVQVLHELSFEINEAELAVILGPNGAGKSTTLAAIMGLVAARSGRVTFGGSDITNVATRVLVRKGIALVPEGRHIFPDLTVEANLKLGGWAAGFSRSRIAEQLRQTYGSFPRLEERRDQLGGTLSGGEQQMLAIGRALMAQPRLILVDESSMGLAPVLVENVFALFRQLADRGTAILAVEQNVGILDHADRVFILEQGDLIYSGGASGLSGARERARQAYLGAGRRHS